MARWISTVWLAAVLFGLVAVVSAQSTGEDDAERAVVERFVAALERNPRRGTAFDKVYSYHVERGTLDELLLRYSNRATEGTGNAAAWMIVGLIESQRGRDAEAIKAFRHAESLDPASVMASYHLGQVLVAGGQSEQAAEAFERAIQRQPAVNDLLEIFQALGRVYQRNQQTAKALDVWNRLERLFPNDARIQEQIATTLLEENDLEAALVRFETLARGATDKFRQSQFQMEAAEIKVRLGNVDNGLRDFERLLQNLNPESWLFRDVRRRIEVAILKQDDPSQVIKYYEKWTTAHPEDLDALSRLASFLARAGRGAEAQNCLRAALKLAPSQRELRLALIEQLRLARNNVQAAAQFQELDRHHPNDPDVLTDWGQFVLSDSTRDKEERNAEATAIWRRLLALRPHDAHHVLRVADLFRRAELHDDGLALYRQAIQLEPDASQYREYLGEYLHALKRTDEALAEWSQLATDTRRNATNLHRLADILARHGELDRAIEAMSDACQLDARDLAIQLKYADLLSRAGKHAEALRQLDAVKSLATTDDERESWLRRELTELNTTGQLAARMTTQRKELDEQTLAPRDRADRLYWLARAGEAANLHREAVVVIATAVELNPQSVPILATAARLNEGQRNLQVAVEQYRKLAAIDRRYRTESLKRITILEERLGHREEALLAGRELLVSAPGNPELGEFFAQMCFRLKRHEEGTQSLRRLLRSNPGNVATMRILASALLMQRQNSEAVELLWQAFDRSRKLDDRLSVVQQLAETHARLNSVQQMYTRLERQRRDAAQFRDITICLARAFEVTGDVPAALTTLESLLSNDAKDLALLVQLREVAERHTQFESAVRYQRRVWKISNAKSDRLQLAQLLLQAGQTAEAVELMTSDFESTELSAEILRLIDGLYSRGIPDSAGRIAQLRERFPDNWELLYREGVVTANASRTHAVECFEKLLELNVPDDEQSLLATSSATAQALTGTNIPILRHLENVKQSVDFKPELVIRGVQRRPRAAAVWMPYDYGTARLAAWNRLLHLMSGVKGGSKAYIAQRFPDPQHPASRRQALDYFLVQAILDNPSEKCDAARQLMRLSNDDVDAKVLYLHSVGDRNSTKYNQSPGLPGTTVKHQSEPLSRERLDEAVAIYRGLCRHPGRSTVDVELLDGLLRELHVSGHLDTAGALYLEATKTVDSVDDICDLLWIENGVSDLRALQHLMDRLLVVPDSPVNAPTGAPNAFRQSAFELISVSLISAIERTDRIDDLMESWKQYVAIHKRHSTDTTSVTHGSGPNAWKNIRNVTLYTARIPGARNGYRALPVSQGFTVLPGLVFKNEGLSILNALWNRYARDRRDEELIRNFKSAVENPEIAEDDLIYRQHGLAYLQWISGRRDAALAILVDVARHHPKRRDLQIGLIQQYELADQPDAALAVLDTLDRTIDEVVNDALLAANGIELNVAGFLDRIELRLAIAANQLERGRRVVGRLQSKIGPQEIAEFTQQMLQLGMKEEAEQALIAARQRAQLDIRQQRVLMDVQMSLGKNEAAGTTAASLLAQIDGPLGARASMTNMRLTMINGQIVETYDKLDIVEFKKACFDVLRDSGRLDKMIETAESQLKSLPKSTATIDQLITLQDAAGNKGRVDELLALKRQITSDRPENRFTLSLNLLEQDKLDESLEQMKILLERDADDFSSRCRNTLFRYDGSRMLAKFASQLTKLDWTTNETRSAALLSIIDQLHARTATSDVADQFFATLWKAQPERRVGLLERFQASHWWDLPDVHQGLRTALATPPARLQDQWAVFGRVLPVEGKDRLITVLNRAISDAAMRGELDAFARDVERGIQTKPEWQAGPVMLAMLDLRRNRIDTASKTLDTFLPTLEPQLRKSPNIAWEIGQELVRTEQGLEIGAKYFDFAIRYQGRADWVSSASPAGALIDTYVALGKKQDAREMLQKNVPQSLRPNPEPNSTVTALDVAHLLSIGRKLRSLGYPVDSIEIYLAALERLKGIGPGGYDPRNELQGCLALAFGELKPEALIEYLEEPVSRTRPLRLHLFLWQNNPERSILTTRWNPILFTIAADQNLATKARRALSQLIEAQPTAVEPLVLSAHLSQSMKDAEAFAGHAKKLLDLINAQPLPKRRNDSSPETGQEALWLIARDCLATPSLAQAGEELANRAVDAALLDVRPDFEVAILKEWILLAERSGDDNRVGRLKKKLDAAELR